jgi:thiamine kinase-like enzyme
MPDRQLHQQEVQSFLAGHLGGAGWELTLPRGWGNETYYARRDDQAYFVKLGVQASRYQAMAALGLTPEVILAGRLADGISILVQPYIPGREPTRRDYRAHLEQFAAVIRLAHHSPEVRRALPAAPCDSYREVGLETLDRLRRRWKHCRPQVSQEAAFVDDSLEQLAGQVRSFQGAGLVASHNDICNANWRITPAGRLYLIDLDSMSLDDPALDTGATLWWYYPPELWGRFLETVGYPDDEAFRLRMRMRLAMHCLSILLPREQSFDRFEASAFSASLVDFRAALAGEANPQGYD